MERKMQVSKLKYKNYATGNTNINATFQCRFAGAIASYQILNAAAISSYACANGDRLCIEIGIGRSVGTTARNGTISFGTSSATDITAAGSTTANNPVLTFSGNLTWYKGVGNGN